MKLEQDDRGVAEAAEFSDEEWERWAEAHPDLVQEVLVARKVRWVMAQLRLSHVEVPAGFEMRLMERLRSDVTLIYLIDLGLSGLGRAFLELLTALMGILPQSQSPLQSQPAQ